MFSIIIPVFNKKKFISRALDSVFSQSFQDYEVIVVDDGSLDGSGEFVRNKYGDAVQLILQENRGVSKARNRGIKEAKFQYIAFLDADDFWHPAYLEFLAEVISQNPETGIIGCHYDPVKLEDNPTLSYIKLDDYFKQAVRNTRFFTSATCVKKEFFEKMPGFDPQLKLGEDIDVWLRASLYFGDGLYIQNTLVFYSQEDLEAATKKKYLLEETFIPKILDPNYYSSSIKNSTCSPETFKAFQSKWAYLNLFPHIGLPENQQSINSILTKIPNHYFLVHITYQLPYSWLEFFFLCKTLSKWYRNYLKFCFRFLYT